MPRRPAKRLALTILSATVAFGALAACNKAAGTATPTPTTDSGGGILSGSPSATTSGPAPTTGTVAPPVPTPHSTLASRTGYVWVYDADSSYAASSAYQYNSAGGAINVNHTATGRYVVTFNGLGGPGGVAHAQAYGSTPNFCSVVSWTPSGANQNVSVRCYDVLGADADTQFVANFAAGSQGSAHFAYLWADQQSNPALYHPSSAYRYDSVDASGLTVKRTDIGHYEVFLPAAGPDLPDPWGFQVTAYGGGKNHCKLQSFDAATKKAKVACFNWSAAYVDLKFSLSFYSEGSLIGRTDRRYGESGTGYSGVSTPAIGQYTATFTEMGAAKGQVVASALGVDETYCHIRSWTVSGADLKANVNCYYPAPDNPAGQLMTSVYGFHASATW